MSENNTKKYGRYFLSLEDNDDDLLNDPNIKANTKIITAKPSNRRTKFYSIGDDYINDNDDGLSDDIEPVDNSEIQDDSLNNPEDTNLDTNVNQDIPEDTTNISDENNPVVTIDGNEVQQDDQSDNAPIIDTDPLVQQIDATNQEIDNNNSNIDPSLQNDIDTSVELNTDEPITDEEPIAVDDNAEGQPLDDGTQPVDDGTGQPQDVKKGPGIEYDSTRKYVLFNRYIDLCKAINEYNEKLSSMSNDNYSVNKIFKIASEKLTEVHDVTYDYMVMRFELSSYIQSLLFYQERIATVYKIFEFVKSSINEINKKNKN